MTPDPVRGPDFLIIGAQRAGTTSLYDYITRHPRVMAAGDKEVRFYDSKFHNGMEWYEGRLLGDARGGRARPRFAAVARTLQRRLTGEATPYYLFHPAVPGRVKSTAPGVKLIAILRDPVARAYSHYNHSVTHGNEWLSFEDALDAEPERLEGEEEKILADPSYSSFSHRNHSYAARGRYVDQLERWRTEFDEEHFLILSSEALFADPRSTMRRVFAFLTLPARDAAMHEPLNATTYDQRMQPDTERRLRNHFRPHNDRLAALIGEDLGWNSL